MISIPQRLIAALRPWPVHALDRTYGIETSQRFNRWRLRSGDAGLDANNVGYVGSQPSVLRRALSVLPTIGPDTTFIDIGCGKGRALVVASEFPFGCIQGIELLKPLCRRASANAAKIAARHPDRSRISVVQGDATRPSLPDRGDVVLYMYNPFFAPLVERLLDALEAHLDKAPDLRAFVVICNPVSGTCLDARARFRRYFAEKVAFSEEDARAAPFSNTWDNVVIWQAASAERRAPAHANAERPIVVKIPNFAAELSELELEMA